MQRAEGDPTVDGVTVEPALGLGSGPAPEPAPEPAPGPSLRRLSAEAARAEALLLRARALAPEPGVPIVRPAEGLAAARVEAAASMRLRRPGPAGPACDYVDEQGRRLSVLGPHPGASRPGPAPAPPPDDWVDALGCAAREEAASGEVDLVAVDASGLSEDQIVRLREELSAALAAAALLVT